MFTGSSQAERRNPSGGPRHTHPMDTTITLSRTAHCDLCGLVDTEIVVLAGTDPERLIESVCALEAHLALAPIGRSSNATHVAERDSRNDGDGIFQQGGPSSVLVVRKSGDRYAAELQMGVQKG